MNGSRQGGVSELSTQEVFSAFLSRSFSLMAARSQLRRERRKQFMPRNEAHKGHSGPIDEDRVLFDLVDGHWD